MTRREWAELAAAIKSERDRWEAGDIIGRCVGVDAIDLLAVRLAAVLDAHHSRFDVKRFLSECGLPPG